jgi:cytosine/adenosine deaminase-related metal-dependent hydrolase
LKLICSDFIITCNSNFDIITDGAILYDKKIIKIEKKETLLEQYRGIEVIYLGENSIIMPSFVNAHLHLEFSSNKTTLKYSDFMLWLGSVIKHREELIEKLGNTIEVELKKLLKSGTGTIGAISSYGFDLEYLVKSPIKKVYFSEAIGSKADMVDALYSDFTSRFYQAQKYESDIFKNAVAIHSPYSIHPIFIKKVLELVKENDSLISTHLLESRAEREWLEESKGDFKEFFKNFLNQDRAITDIDEFLSHFKNFKTLFVHNLEAKCEYFKDMPKAHIISCPRSNRLLNNRVLDEKFLESFDISIATDGLSSNSSLNMFDELRAFIYSYPSINLKELAKEAILSSTKYPAEALGFNNGELSEGRASDFITLILPDRSDIDDLLVNLILQTDEVNSIYIDGEIIC